MIIMISFVQWNVQNLKKEECGTGTGVPVEKGYLGRENASEFC